MKQLISYDGETITSTVSSNYGHYVTSLGILRNVPIALGGYYSDDKKVESLHAGSWKILGDYPFAESYICRYSFAAFNDALFVFGKILICSDFEN